MKKGYYRVDRTDAKYVQVALKYSKGWITLAEMRDKPLRQMVEKWVEEGFKRELANLSEEDKDKFIKMLLRTEEEKEKPVNVLKIDL